LLYISRNLSISSRSSDQWIRIEDPDINSRIYSQQRIFDKGTQNTQWRKTASSTNAAGKTGYLHVEE
jgi:hypothetical protein